MNTKISVPVGDLRGKKVSGLEVRAEGDRRAEHPTILTSITLDYRLSGEGLDGPAVEQALKMAEEKFCPVWAMLGPNVAVSCRFEIQ